MGGREELPLVDETGLVAATAALVEASGLSPLWGADVARKSAEAAILAYRKYRQDIMRCTITGFVVDLAYEATKPEPFTMAGRSTARAHPHA